MHTHNKVFRRTLALAATMATASAVVIFSGSDAMASYTKCVYDNSSDTVLGCGGDSGTGLHISTMSGNAGVYVNDSSGYILQECLHGPTATIGCTSFQYIAPGGEIQVTWSPNANELPGQYCANTWAKNTFESSDYLLVQVCWSVFE